jgi:CheY-like chemotaxis protein
LLNHPEVKPSPETCHKLAEVFNVEPLLVLELAGHVASAELGDVAAEFEEALSRVELRKLLLSAQNLLPADVKLVQQLVDQLQIKRQEEAGAAAQGAAVALVVEDTRDSRELFVQFLKHAGLKVLEAADGQRALELIESSGELIDVVLMDYRMPRMDGVEATRKIRQRFPNLPVMFISAYSEPEMKQAAFDAGAAEYLVSPVDFEELVDAISRVRRSKNRI